MKECCRKGCKRTKCITRANSLWSELNGGTKPTGRKQKKKKKKRKRAN